LPAVLRNPGQSQRGGTASVLIKVNGTITAPEIVPAALREGAAGRVPASLWQRS
jgi:hypothetical protein